MAEHWQERFIRCVTFPRCTRIYDGDYATKVGLLPKDNEQQIPFAYKLYKRVDKEGIALCAGFKQTFCQSVNIEFVGVW